MEDLIRVVVGLVLFAIPCAVVFGALYGMKPRP